ncbi:hypothetical protein TNCV_2696401 [Trichonephila clavipes]|nr:hypothetical protein TNCV_2696401 [Trichonephila clavipes]
MFFANQIYSKNLPASDHSHSSGIMQEEHSVACLAAEIWFGSSRVQNMIVVKEEAMNNSLWCFPTDSSPLQGLGMWGRFPSDTSNYIRLVSGVGFSHKHLSYRETNLSIFPSEKDSANEHRNAGVMRKRESPSNAGLSGGGGGSRFEREY